MYHNVASRASRLEHISRLQALWIPVAPKLRLGGIKLTPAEAEEIGVEGELKDGNVYVSEPGGVPKGLAAIWKVVFGYKATNPAAAKRLLRDYNPGWNWSLAKNPTPEMVSDVMEVRKNCMPGLDGTPKAAWKFGGQHTLNYNMRLTDAFFLNEPEEIEAHTNCLTSPIGSMGEVRPSERRAAGEVRQSQIGTNSGESHPNIVYSPDAMQST